MARKVMWITALAALCVGTLCVCALSAPPPVGQSAKVFAPAMFPTWQGWHVSYPFVIEDSAAGGYRMYYSGAGSMQVNDSISDQWMTGQVTSADTVSWTGPDTYEPILIPRKLYEGDVLDRDDMSAQFDSMFAIGACVIKESASSYKMWYTGWNGDTEHLGNGITNRINFRIGYATSSDGINWTKQPGSAGAGSIFGVGSPGSLESKGVGQSHVLKEGSNYRMWYEGFDGTHWRIFYATSADGITWTRQGLTLDKGSSGAPDALGARNPVVVFRNGLYEMWYQGRRATEPNYSVLRATSPNGLEWTKVEEEVELHLDYALSGSEIILVDSVLVQTDGSAQIFFARQITSPENLTYATLNKRYTNIYTEVIP